MAGRPFPYREEPDVLKTAATDFIHARYRVGTHQGGYVASLAYNPDLAAAAGTLGIEGHII